MHSIYEMKFRRRFSVNPFKTLRMKLGEMSCHKNWVDDQRGDPYPVLDTNEREGVAIAETLPGGRYRAENRADEALYKARLLGQHFPYATYEIAQDELTEDGLSGMGVEIFASGEEGSDYTKENEPRLSIRAARLGGKMRIIRQLTVGGAEKPVETVETEWAWREGTNLCVTSRGMYFDVYLDGAGVYAHICTFAVPEMQHILRYNTFSRSVAAVYVYLEPGAAVQGGAQFFLEGGLSQADIKCMKYENGMPIMREGRLFMTMSARLEAGSIQIVCSWSPSTADIRLEGALFFDLGDGVWCSDVAASVVYNRKTDEWYVWACAFSHGHILCHAVSYADLRYGIHVLDAETVPVQRLSAAEADSLGQTAGGVWNGRAELSDDRLFFGKSGDEDPDFLYDEKRGKWLLAVCRLTEEEGGHPYRYFLFESDDPFEGYVYVDRTTAGSVTGGSIIRVGGEMYLLCGSDLTRRGCYQLHPLNDLSAYSLIRFDYDDGGFRGWGQLIPVPCGRRTRYVWMTFDRHNGSGYTWSYGNLHVFEADLMNDGWEWAEKPGKI